VLNLPIDKMKNGTYRVRSYVTGKRLKTVYKSRAAAVKAAATSKRRSKRKRSTGSKRAKKSGYY
tara:strand:+ start:304 stop:495 length:192 start_codon:yes stop_codon:yes gene_type:complete